MLDRQNQALAASSELEITQTPTCRWQPAAPLTGSSVVTTIAPALVALDGGSDDVMVVYVHAGDASDYHLQYAVRTAAGGAWSAPADVYDQGGNVAYAGSAPSLAALPNGGGHAIVAWQGGDMKPYASTYDGTAWSAPAAVAQSTVGSPPSVAAGVCGATAVAALALTGGEVQVATLGSGGAWGTPLAIAGASGMTYAAIASAP